jgi:Flp pilus assembly protein TadD
VLKEVVVKDPENADALNYLGYTYADLGINLDEAKQLIDKALRLQPEEGYIIDSLGWVYFRKGNYAAAFTELSRAYSLMPDDPVVNEHMGDVNYRLGQVDKALPFYLKAWELGPEDFQIEKLKMKIDHLKEGKKIDELL